MRSAAEYNRTIYFGGVENTRYPNQKMDYNAFYHADSSPGEPLTDSEDLYPISPLPLASDTLKSALIQKSARAWRKSQRQNISSNWPYAQGPHAIYALETASYGISRSSSGSDWSPISIQDHDNYEPMVSNRDYENYIGRIDSASNLSAQQIATSKCRQLPCRTWISTGTCPYNDRCVFLHDRRVMSKPVTMMQGRKKSKEDICPDSYFWPTMTKESVSESLDHKNLPVISQHYIVPNPSSVRSQETAITLGLPSNSHAYPSANILLRNLTESHSSVRSLNNCTSYRDTSIRMNASHPAQTIAAANGGGPGHVGGLLGQDRDPTKDPRHVAAVYSMWNYFLDFCASDEHSVVKELRIVAQPDPYNPFNVHTGGSRLPILMALSQGKSIESTQVRSIAYDPRKDYETPKIIQVANAPHAINTKSYNSSSAKIDKSVPDKCSNQDIQSSNALNKLHYQLPATRDAKTLSVDITNIRTQHRETTINNFDGNLLTSSKSLDFRGALSLRSDVMLNQNIPEIESTTIFPPLTLFKLAAAANAASSPAPDTLSVCLPLKTHHKLLDVVRRHHHDDINDTGETTNSDASASLTKLDGWRVDAFVKSFLAKSSTAAVTCNGNSAMVSRTEIIGTNRTEIIGTNRT